MGDTVAIIPETGAGSGGINPTDAKGWADLFAQIFGGAPTTKTETGAKTETGTKLESGQKTEGQMDIVSSAATEPMMQMLAQLIPGSTGGLANPQAQQLIEGLLTQFKEGSSGLSGIQAAGNAAGVYNSSTQGLLANDAMSRALASAAGVVSTQQNQQQQVIANLLNSLRAGTQQQSRVTGTNTGQTTQTAGQTNTGQTTTTQTGGLAQTNAGRAAAALGALGAAMGAANANRKPPAKPAVKPGTDPTKNRTSPETAAPSGTTGEVSAADVAQAMAMSEAPDIGVSGNKGDQEGDYPQFPVNQEVGSDPFAIGGYSSPGGEQGYTFDPEAFADFSSFVGPPEDFMGPPAEDTTETDGSATGFNEGDYNVNASTGEITDFDPFDPLGDRNLGGDDISGGTGGSLPSELEDFGFDASGEW